LEEEQSRIAARGDGASPRKELARVDIAGWRLASKGANVQRERARDKSFGVTGAAACVCEV
jgi:hypothetical protein